MRVGADELAEIFIFRQENALLAKRQVHDQRIIVSRRQFCDRKHSMADGTKRSNDGEVATLVGEKAHS